MDKVKANKETRKIVSLSIKSIFLAFIFLFSFISISAFNFEGDGVKIISPLSKSGFIEVELQDQHSEILDLYLTHANTVTNPSSPIYIDERNVTVNNITGALVGNAINIYENGHYYQAIILAINANTITTNVPFDYNFTIAATVELAEWNMNVDGGINVRDFEFCATNGVDWDITRIIFSIADNAAMDDGTFGGIPALERGLVLRVVDGYTKNIFVVSDNGGFAERAYDTRYASKAPAGLYGFQARRTFSGQDKNGVTIRLEGETNDCIVILIQDDLTGLNKLASVIQGHMVV